MSVVAELRTELFKDGDAYLTIVETVVRQVILHYELIPDSTEKPSVKPYLEGLKKAVESHGYDLTKWAAHELVILKLGMREAFQTLLAADTVIKTIAKAELTDRILLRNPQGNS